MTNLSSSLAAVVLDRNTWHSRADQAWGNTRVWNSGTSFEAAYNAEVTLYNNEVAAYNTEYANARDTSAGTHPTGWASGQLWSTTSSQWQTQYNNVLPPVAADQIIGTNISTSMNGGGSGMTNATELVRITIDRTGYWAFAGYVQSGASGDGTTIWLTIYSAGTTLGSNSFGFTPNHGANSAGSGAFAAPALLTSGAVVSLYGVKDGTQNVPSLTQQGLRGWFMPTQAYPH